jgi:uncharacterized membrane protein YgdD (TMEM256/DUF423 family)
MPIRCIIPLAALLAATAVGLGAYSAHGLEKHLESVGHAADLTERLDWFDTGVRYHLYHALGLLLVGVLASREGSFVGSSKALRLAAAAFVVGITLFSGSLYVMTLAPADWRWLGAVVPLGGVSLIVGWLVVAYATWNR